MFWCSTVKTRDIREVKYSGKRKKTRSVLFPSGLDFKDPLENNLLLLCSYGAGGVTRSAERGGARAQPRLLPALYNVNNFLIFFWFFLFFSACRQSR